LHRQFDNIVDGARLRGIEWRNPGLSAVSGPPLTFFIGDPFSEIFDEDQIARITRYARQMNIDFYVQHPRETRPLPLGAKILDKNGRIAEHAIIAASGGRPFHLVGGFSSVLFNLSDIATRKTMVVPADARDAVDQERLARRADIHVELI